MARAETNHGKFSLETIKGMIEAIEPDVTMAFQLKPLHKKVTYDERIPDLWNGTKEGNAFELTQRSIALTLVMTLVRIWDDRQTDDVHSFPKLFKLLISNGKVRDNVRVAIESWLDQLNRQDKLSDYIETLEKNAKRFDELTKSKVVTQIRALRHKFIAHNATDKTSEFPKHEFLDKLVDESISIFENVSVASIGSGYSFKEEQRHWEECTELFFESLVAGQSTQLNNGK